MRNNNKGQISFLVTLVVLGISISFLLVCCAFNFYLIERNGESNNDLRAVNSYLSSMILSHNEVGCIVINDEGNTLTLIEKGENENFLVSLFIKDGFLCETYSIQGNVIDVEDATQIANTSFINISKISDELLKVTSDEGDIFVNVVAGGVIDEY